MAVELKSVTFWINAFIPRDMVGLTRLVPKGTHAGKTMIDGPFPISDCFLTDQRSFSNSRIAASRMHSELQVTRNGTRLVFAQRHKCDHTTECDCEDGEEECHKQASTARMRFILPSNPDPALPVKIRLSGAASNPCHGNSPDIDYDGFVTIDWAGRSVEFRGRIDQFPAFEAYASVNNRPGVPLFQISPKPGKTPGDLFGGPTESVYGKVRDRSGTGQFEKEH